MQPHSTVSRGASATSAPQVAGARSHFLRVYYEDTDAGGVVYYANYLKFCERARTEWLRALGVSQQALLSEAGIGFVVRSVQADFLSPARLDDELEVRTHIESLRRASIVFKQSILRSGQLLFTAHAQLACVDMKLNKPTAIPPNLLSSIQSQA